MTTAWAHLPNAELIDQLLVDLQNAARDTALIAARGTAWNAAWTAAWNAARAAARGTAWNTARDAAWYVARDAASALVAYDDCGWMLAPGTSSDVLLGLIRFNQDPAATLLLRYKLFLENRDGQTSS